MTSPPPPPAPCIVCGSPDCDDFMYRCGLVPAERAICGDCKIDLGKKLEERMIRLLAGRKP